jgi:DUF917 family protein
MIRSTVSQSWRIGRAVELANMKGNIGNIGDILVETLGGEKTARVLGHGKITDVSRKVYKGHTVGEVSITAVATDAEERNGAAGSFSGTLQSKLGRRDQIKLSRC